ncbi:Hypothetical_protein [Hexamita inflata]|uniref:Hypothetical_protein n=1 Tax=Hexamita inflata TaxID=28002 RepID=A0ABP1GHW8_9EUKA
MLTKYMTRFLLKYDESWRKTCFYIMIGHQSCETVKGQPRTRIFQIALPLQARQLKETQIFVYSVHLIFQIRFTYLLLIWQHQQFQINSTPQMQIKTHILSTIFEGEELDQIILTVSNNSESENESEELSPVQIVNILKLTNFELNKVSQNVELVEIYQESVEQNAEKLLQNQLRMIKELEM